MFNLHRSIQTEVFSIASSVQVKQASCMFRSENDKKITDVSRFFKGNFQLEYYM